MTFLAGLAISQLADGYARHLGFVGPYFSLGIALVTAVFVCGFGYLSSCGSLVALIVGMSLYALAQLQEWRETRESRSGQTLGSCHVNVSVQN